jgi:zinc protease
MMQAHRLRAGDTPVLLIEEPTLALVRVIVVFREGAVADPDGGAGTTRLLLDMLLRGTHTLNRVAFNARLEEMGSQVDAITGAQAAFLRITCLSRHLAATMDLVGQALAEPAFDAGELEALTGEAIEMLRSEREDDDTLAELFLRRALYPGHGRGRNPQGEVADLGRVTVADLRRAHTRATANLLVAFAGDVDADQAVAATGTLVAGLCNSRVCEPPADPDHRLPDLHFVVVDKPERTQVQLRLAQPALAGDHEDALGFWLGTTAFGGTFTAPFSREVRDRRGWSYTASAAWDRRSRLAGPLLLASAPAVSDLLDCLALEIELANGLARGEIDDSDLELARTYLCNREPLARASGALWLPAVIKHELLGRPLDELVGVEDRLQGLSRKRVRSIMRQHLEVNRWVVVLVATATDLVGPLEARFADARVSVVDYREGLEP